MTTSGVYNLTWDRNTIIKDALSKIGVASAFYEPAAEDYAIGAKNLNYYIKYLEQKGLRPPQLYQAYVFLSGTKNTYTLGVNGDHATLSYNQTALTSSAASGASAIVVNGVTGFVAGYNIGIQLDDGTMQWTTISSVVGTTINLATTLTASASSGNIVFAYQNKIQKPLVLHQVTRYSIAGDDTNVEVYNRSDYFNISNKTAIGAITGVHYSPKINDGILYVYPQTNNVTDVLKLDIEYPLEIFTASGQTPPFPDKWALPLIYGTAFYCADDFGFNGAEYELLAQKYRMLEDELLSTDVADKTIQFIVE
jgi:hypothetical protein